MQTAAAPTATAADLGVALPSTGRFNDPAAQGRLAALRTFTAAMTTMDGLRDYDDIVHRVVNGKAPEAFKNAFLTTLRSLSAALTTEN